ncbi:nucleotidyltransferase domain-containing protein [Candidatus Roizmanbacteria bacterium]|nr:nucleotidyltransferase domain-containing protein [Candidatus Roizmanbacteria bacterium]
MNTKVIEKDILETLGYFSRFNYPPTIDEIHTFLKKRAQKRHLASILAKIEKQRLIKSQKSKKTRVSDFEFQIKNSNRYTLGEYSNQAQIYEKRRKISQKKIKKVLSYIRILSLFPQIKLVGLSGSVAMLNADADHDIDLFIITAKNRLFTGRFLALLLAQIMGTRRKRDFSRSTFHVLRSTDKVCLNLFLDESNLALPNNKKTEYGAHEVLQMKPLVQKDESYLKFIDTNRWVFDIFPNAQELYRSVKRKDENRVKKDSIVDILLRLIGDSIESMLKKLQLHFIKKHMTNEIVTNTQLWFHPDDYAEKIKSQS